MTKTIKELLDDFVEKGADLEHERWSKWQSYFFSKCQVKPQSQVNGMDDRYVYLALPKDLYDRWNRQMNTLYPELSEQERESDRIEVRKYLPLVSSITSQVEALVRGEEREKGFQEGKNYFRSLRIGENAEELVKNTRNAVLSEVEREWFKAKAETFSGQNEAENCIETIINNLRVK